MGTWALIQVVFNIFIALGLFVVIMRMNRAPKDDPRLSRGLQLLQSKIAVLEDLSDRTEMQVSQLTAILEQKAREVQAKVQLAEQSVHEIRVSMERSLEVAKIFQDKIPHEEIIERQNTLKYVQAARMAHQGMTVDQIAEKVDLPKGEIEFIAKVNRDQLTFSEEQLPWWAKEGAESGVGSIAPNPAQSSAIMSQAPSFTLPQNPAVAGLSFEPNEVELSNNSSGAIQTEAADPQRFRAEIELAERQRLVENLSRLQFEMQNLDLQLAREAPVRDLSQAFEVPKVETSSLQKLGEEFRKACEQANLDESRSPFLPPLDQLTSIIPQVIGTELEGAIKSKAEHFATKAEQLANKVTEAFGNMALPNTPVHPMHPSHQAAQQPVEQNSQAQIAPPMSSMEQMQQVPEAAPRDPVLARAAAQAKVQAALNRGRSSVASTQLAPVDQMNPELEAARALAREAALANAAQLTGVQPNIVQPAATQAASSNSPQAQQHARTQPLNLSPVINSKGGQAPVIRKVQFPRIDDPKV